MPKSLAAVSAIPGTTLAGLGCVAALIASVTGALATSSRVGPAGTVVGAGAEAGAVNDLPVTASSAATGSPSYLPLASCFLALSYCFPSISLMLIYWLLSMVSFSSCLATSTRSVSLIFLLARICLASSNVRCCDPSLPISGPTVGPPVPTGPLSVSPALPAISEGAAPAPLGTLDSVPPASVVSFIFLRSAM